MKLYPHTNIFLRLQKKQEGLQAKLEQMNTDGDLDDTLVDDDDAKHRHVAKGKHSRGSKTSYSNGRLSREEALQLEDLEPTGVSAVKVFTCLCSTNARHTCTS